MLAITAATITLFDVEMNSFVRSSCVFSFVSAVWILESVLSALSLFAACRYYLQRKTRSGNKDSNIMPLVTFLFFSVIPCLQMVPAAYDSALLFVQELARQTHADCLRNINANTEDDLARHIRCESAAIGYCIYLFEYIAKLGVGVRRRVTQRHIICRGEARCQRVE